MVELFDTRRYLTNFDSTRMSNILTDVLVIGSGVAGACAAIEAARYGTVTLLAKADFEQSATGHAQGGIAAAIGPGDSAQAHFDDTVRVGCGLNAAEAVRLLVTDGPRRIEELIEWGIELDRAGEEFALAREGGHSLNRIVHAHGDQTGRELVGVLKPRVLEAPNIRVFENCYLIDLITVSGTCLGVIAFHERHGHQLIWAKQTVLASGGGGQLWRETTNPRGATGDGYAAAYRAGAMLRNLEMMQFHPTTLYVAGSGRALISEAVRGEGAYLLDHEGNRFMQDHHPDAELAPRDVVSRAIHEHLQSTRSNCVYLDVRHIPEFAKRFPQVARLCADFEIDVTKDRIPVRPSAHYMIGGVEVKLDGCTSIEGLLCCGEVAHTGVHGANRLASNSLLEGLVFGRLAGQTAGQKAAEDSRALAIRQVVNRMPTSRRTELDLPDIRNSLRSVMWRNVGIVREGSRLRETGDIISFWGHYTLDKTFNDVVGWETVNMLTVARLIAVCALERSESIGVHYRTDSPSATALEQCHTPSVSYHLAMHRASDGLRLERVLTRSPGPIQ